MIFIYWPYIQWLVVLLFSYCSFCQFHRAFNLHSHVADNDSICYFLSYPCFLLYWWKRMFWFPPNLRESSQCLTIKYDVHYRFFWGVFQQILVSRLYKLHTMCWGKFSSIFWKNLCKLDCFFLKCFMEFTGEAIWTQNSFVGKVLIKKSISLGHIGLLIFSISPMSYASFFPWGIVHFI